MDSPTPPPSNQPNSVDDLLDFLGDLSPSTANSTCEPMPSSTSTTQLPIISNINLLESLDDFSIIPNSDTEVPPRIAVPQSAPDILLHLSDTPVQQNSLTSFEVLGDNDLFGDGLNANTSCDTESFIIIDKPPSLDMEEAPAEVDLNDDFDESNESVMNKRNTSTTTGNIDEAEINFDVLSLPTSTDIGLSAEHYKGQIAKQGSYALRRKPSRKGVRTILPNKEDTLFIDSTEPKAEVTSPEDGERDEKIPKHEEGETTLSPKALPKHGFAMPGLQDLNKSKLFSKNKNKSISDDEVSPTSESPKDIEKEVNNADMKDTKPAGVRVLPTLPTNGAIPKLNKTGVRVLPSIPKTENKPSVEKTVCNVEEENVKNKQTSSNDCISEDMLFGDGTEDMSDTQEKADASFSIATTDNEKIDDSLLPAKKLDSSSSADDIFVVPSSPVTTKDNDKEDALLSTITKTEELDTSISRVTKPETEKFNVPLSPITKPETEKFNVPLSPITKTETVSVSENENYVNKDEKRDSPATSPVAVKSLIALEKPTPVVRREKPSTGPKPNRNSFTKTDETAVTKNFHDPISKNETKRKTNSDETVLNKGGNHTVNSSSKGEDNSGESCDQKLETKVQLRNTNRLPNNISKRHSTNLDFLSSAKDKSDKMAKIQDRHSTRNFESPSMEITKEPSWMTEMKSRKHNSVSDKNSTNKNSSHTSKDENTNKPSWMMEIQARKNRTKVDSDVSKRNVQDSKPEKTDKPSWMKTALDKQSKVADMLQKENKNQENKNSREQTPPLPEVELRKPVVELRNNSNKKESVSKEKDEKKEKISPPWFTDLQLRKAPRSASNKDTSKGNVEPEWKRKAEEKAARLINSGLLDH